MATVYARVLDVRVTDPVRTVVLSACQGVVTSCSAAASEAAVG